MSAFENNEDAFDYWTFEGAAWFLHPMGFNGKLIHLDKNIYKFSLKYGDVETIGIHKTRWGALDDALTKMKKYVNFDSICSVKESSA